ncbi:MAG: hypothetical protein II816_07600 [Elusimicrobia bacterium]|nr:hypothetical protein [Elusimicrobiota bacterium]
MNKLKLFFVFLVATIILSSCATSYKKASSPEGCGYYDSILQQDIYEVTFNGNEYTSSTKAHDYALLRAAETCLENGYTTFDIVNSNDKSKTSIGTYTNYNGSYASTYISSSTYPKITLIIKCSKENNLTFIAEEIKENLRNKYNLK